MGNERSSLHLPLKQVGVGTMVISGSLGGVIVSTLAWNATDVGLIPDLGNNISHFHHTHDTGFQYDEPVQAACCMIVESILSMYM